MLIDTRKIPFIFNISKLWCSSKGCFSGKMAILVVILHQNKNSTINPQHPRIILYIPIFLIYPLLCCSPSDRVTHSFHVESWRAPPTAHRNSSNSLTFVKGYNRPGESAPGQMPPSCHSGGGHWVQSFSGWVWVCFLKTFKLWSFEMSQTGLLQFP